jgi:hypothetical protein
VATTASGRMMASRNFNDSRELLSKRTGKFYPACQSWRASCSHARLDHATHQAQFTNNPLAQAPHQPAHFLQSLSVIVVK